MVLTIEISQSQFDKVVFVPVVQSVQFILPSTSLPWRRGWFPWSCMSKTIVIPPVAVHVVVDVPVMLWLQVPQVRMVQTMQYTVETGRAGHSCRDAEADPHGLVDYGDSPAALRRGDYVPGVEVV